MQQYAPVGQSGTEDAQHSEDDGFIMKTVPDVNMQMFDQLKISNPCAA